MKVFKIVTWRGNNFKTSNPETVKKWKDRKVSADRNNRFAFPITITRVHVKRYN